MSARKSSWRIFALLGTILVVGMFVRIAWIDHQRRTFDMRVGQGTPGSSIDTPNRNGTSLSAPLEQQIANPKESPRHDGGRAQAGLVIRVADPSGRPIAGLPVSLGCELRPKDQPLRATSDPSGLAAFRDVAPSTAEDQFCVLVHDVCFEHLPSQQLTSLPNIDGYPTSTQPECGSIDVEVEAPDGGNVEEEAVVQLVLLSRQNAGSGRNVAGAWNVATQHGHALFPFVELGRTWLASAGQAAAGRYDQVKAAGPTTANASVSVVVRQGTYSIVVGYVAVTEDGKAFAESPLEIDEYSADGSHRRRTLRTASNGAFRHQLSGGGTLILTGVGKDGIRIQGKAAVSATTAPGYTNGGIVVLRLTDVVLAGTVLDVNHHGIGHARVAVSLPGRRTLFVDGRPQGDEILEGESDEAGDFFLRGVLPQHHVLVHAEKDDQASDPQLVESGSRGLLLEIGRSSRIRGLVLADPYFVSDNLVFSLKANGRPLSKDTHWTGNQFEIGGVSTGVYDLTWSYDGIIHGTVPQLVVRGDTDIGVIDLSGKVVQCRITLVGEVPAAPIGGDVMWRASGSRGDWNRHALEGCATTLNVNGFPVEAWIRPEGYRFGHIAEGGKEITFQLMPPLRVWLELSTDGRLPAYPFCLVPILKQDGVEIGHPEGAGCFEGETRTLSFLVSSPGHCDLYWKLQQQIDGGTVSSEILRDYQRELLVSDADADRVFSLSLPGSAMETIDELSRRPRFKRNQ